MSNPFNVTLTEHDGEVLYTGTIYADSHGAAIDRAAALWAGKAVEPEKMKRRIREAKAVSEF